MSWRTTTNANIQEKLMLSFIEFIHEVTDDFLKKKYLPAASANRNKHDRIAQDAIAACYGTSRENKKAHGLVAAAAKKKVLKRSHWMSNALDRIRVKQLRGTT